MKPMFGLYQMKDKKVFLVCTLDQPDTKLLPLYFWRRPQKNFAKSTPYLAMCQDKAFNRGESVTKRFCKFDF
jgi:ribose-phosphate pyrophosphokinase